MTGVQRRVLRVAAWVAAVVGAVLLVLTFVLRGYSYRTRTWRLCTLCRRSWWWRCWLARWWPASRLHCCRWRCWSRRGCGGGLNREHGRAVREAASHGGRYGGTHT